MKKYKLLKDLPTFKAGQMFVLLAKNEKKACYNKTFDEIIYEQPGLHMVNDNGEVSVLAYHQTTLDKFPNILGEWFEKIEESKTWKPNACEQYYYINPDCEICSEQNDNSPFDINAIAIGNCFQTRKDAEEVVEKLRALRELRERGFRFTNLSTSIHERCEDGIHGKIDHFDISAGIDNISGEDWGFVTSRMKIIFAEAETNYE